MRYIKSIIGWLCLLSLVTTVGLFVGSTYIVVEPFLTGRAEIYRLPHPDVLATAPRIAEGGINSSDNELLEKYAKQQSEPVQVWRGLDGALQALFERNITESSDRRTGVAAAAVLDEQGRVVAAYPRDLLGKVFPFAMPLSEIQDSQTMDANGQFWSTGHNLYPVWTAEFAREVGRYVDDPGQVYLAKVKDRNGRVEGILAVVAYDHRSAISIPSGTLDRELVLELQAAGISVLILHLLLLPLWVGMDAHRRGMRPFAWGALVAITNAIGLGAYLLARLPGAYPCPNCSEEVLGKFVRCPACGVTLMNRCPICQTRMRPGWQYCPVCNVSPTRVLETTTPKGSGEPLASRLMESTRANLCINVVDADTGDPMPNARASVTGRASRVDGMTNVAGVFEARKLRSGKYTIAVTRAGYEPAEAELDISEAPESVQLRLRAMPSRIIGRVVERGTMRPVAGVRVYIDSSRVERSTLTGSEGGFVLEDIAAGPYTVAVDGVGFGHQTRLAEVAPGQQVTLDFSVEPAENAV